MLPLLLLACQAPPAPDGPIFRQDHVLLVWMPYDNDLSGAAPVVLEALRAGTEGGGVEVAAQVDTPEQRWMQRVSFAEGRGQAAAVEGAEDSGDITALADFLAWAEARYEARRYSVFVLDHGGRLDQLARDDHPGAGDATWLAIEPLADALEGFRAREPGEVELLSLQVCGKATIEAAWTFRKSARVTLASQLPLGAPNTWYTPVLRQLASHPAWRGEDIARAIAEAEGPEMYAGLTCVDNAALAGLPEVLGPAVRQPLQVDEAAMAPWLWTYAGDTLVDLGALLQRAEAPEHRALAGFLDTARCGHYRSEAPPELLTVGFPDPAGLSGWSLTLAPQGLPASYRKLGFYQDEAVTRWVEGLGPR
ncbi:MAG: hypothetical protein H6739_08860 [Alphaproteobacteria bacterium]|nr:hypothetical protein [Alphaproteobacteria bacterium]